jgi:voltage-gated potassium channel Kch
MNIQIQVSKFFMAVYDQITVFYVATQCTPVSAYRCFRGILVLEWWYWHQPISLGGTITQTTKCKNVSKTTALLQLAFAVFYTIFKHQDNLNIIIAPQVLDHLLQQNSINIFSSSTCDILVRINNTYFIAHASNTDDRTGK